MSTSTIEYTEKRVKRQGSKAMGNVKTHSQAGDERSEASSSNPSVKHSSIDKGLGKLHAVKAQAMPRRLIGMN